MDNEILNQDLITGLLLGYMFGIFTMAIITWVI